VDATAYLSYLEVDGPVLSSLARQDPSTPVPTCPKWTLGDLLAHVGSAHRWAEETVRARATDFCPFAKPPKDFDSVCTWYEQGCGQLLETLTAVDPAEPVWNWLAMGVAPARFWHRRMAHETSVHRWDAENALGATTPVPRDLALDGIDEYLDIVSFSLSMTPNEALQGKIGIEAVDAPLASTLHMVPSHLRRQEGLDGADVVVRASSSDLLLWLLGRRLIDGDDITADGDRSVIDTWVTVRF
jgi:uncharacterized protein (TIGR03083 family)